MMMQFDENMQWHVRVCTISFGSGQPKETYNINERKEVNQTTVIKHYI
jgi:hypothetical protein